MKISLKTIFTIHAVIFLVYGIMDLFIAESALTSFADDVVPTPALIFWVHAVGATFISLAVLAWFMRDAELSYGRRAGLFSLAVGAILSTGLQILGIMEGILNNMNWIGVLLTTLFAIAYVYYGSKEHTQIMERNARATAKA